MSKSNNTNGKELLGLGRVTRGKSSFPFVFSLYFIMVCNLDPENYRRRIDRGIFRESILIKPLAKHLLAGGGHLNNSAGGKPAHRHNKWVASGFIPQQAQHDNLACPTCSILVKIIVHYNII